MAQAKSLLPPLAFGNIRSKVHIDLDKMQQRVNSITNWTSEFDILDKEFSFRHRTATLLAGDLRLLAVSSTPTVMTIYDPDCTIAIPVAGSLDTWVNNKFFRFNVGEHAMFFPKGTRRVEAQIRSGLLVSVGEDRLNKTASTMLCGNELVDLDLDLNTPRLLSLNVGKLDFTSIFKYISQQIDQVNGDELLLKNLGIDDNVYRALVMMLRPELFLETTLNEKSTATTDELDMVCEYIQANLNGPTSLTSLEKLSGLSAKTLQVAFLRKFACTPMEWVKEQRLALAYQLLSNATSTTKIGVVAAICGYSNFGDFSRYYAKRYQELPSQTLAKALKGR
jgi:AraC-like DNA-binding protein